MSVAKDINVSFSLHQPERSSKGSRAAQLKASKLFYFRTVVG